VTDCATARWSGRLRIALSGTARVMSESLIMIFPYEIAADLRISDQTGSCAQTRGGLEA
jgi:hypothetical protein